MSVHRRSRPGGPPLPGDWDGLVVVCAGTSWDGVWSSEKHMATQLARLGIPVLFVDPPLSRLTVWRKPALADSLRGPRLRVAQPGLAHVTPVSLPGVERPVLREAAWQARRRAMRKAVAALGAPHVKAVVAAMLDDVFEVFGDERRVLYGTDDYVAGAELMGLSREWLRQREQRQIAAVDEIVAISPTLQDRWQQMSGRRVHLIPNGVDAAAFAQAGDGPTPSDVILPRPIVGFSGHLSHRIDVDLLDAVAARGHSLLLVGPRQATFDMARMDALIERPNVQWVGSKPFDELAGYLGVMDVGITPYGDTDFNRASLPLKTLEYLAAGCATVATDLPAVRWLDAELGSGLVTVAAPGAGGFAAAVDRALDEARAPAKVARRRAAAASLSWERRARQFAAVVAPGAGVIGFAEGVAAS